jgi:RNA recognition motif-containing protein
VSLFLFSEKYLHIRDNTKRGEEIIMPRLFVGNLGHDCRAKDIEKFFKSFGPVRYERGKFQSSRAQIIKRLRRPEIDSARLGIDSLS